MMRLLLLSCANIEKYVKYILPLIPLKRQQSYCKSRSVLTLGAGLILAAFLNVHDDHDISYGPYGKPFLSTHTMEFSLSHSLDHVLLGISDSPIGVDMEHTNRIVSQSLQNKICLSEERNINPLLVYTRKECAMKLTGLGFSLPFTKINTTSDFIWDNRRYSFLSTEENGYLISVLTAEDRLSDIQHLTPEMLL